MTNDHHLHQISSPGFFSVWIIVYYVRLSSWRKRLLYEFQNNAKWGTKYHNVTLTTLCLTFSLQASVISTMITFTFFFSFYITFVGRNFSYKYLSRYKNENEFEENKTKGKLRHSAVRLHSASKIKKKKTKHLSGLTHAKTQDTSMRDLINDYFFKWETKK